MTLIRAATFALAVLVVPVRATANSARNVHTQLAGITKAVLAVSVETVPGLDANQLELDVLDQLKAAGIEVSRSAPVTLFVHVTDRELPTCEDFLRLKSFTVRSLV